MFNRKPSALPTAAEALPGRETRPFPLAERHLVLDAPLEAAVPEGYQEAIFGLGCFWGAEEVFWKVPGVYSTSVGYAGGITPHPTYEEVCTGRTGHTEAVRVVYDPEQVSYADLVKVFFEVHDPTQGMRQGNDVGTQYRSAVYWTTPEQEAVARKLIEAYQPALTAAGYGDITTEVAPAPTYYYAEDVHQQYLYKVPNGYRCHAATGVPFPETA
ncbi:peptide-methionine (S)-S-oxide reductase MsrA [Nocardioides guangzhouensis]|uniref:Peptide methionine sulfoxide reductase MsrA n=1 Tax=Nocardioides guangzhouensis TaxID=2497878 RepID=A0A4Q4ZK54_9ACTN|nr:peptide-methionine (S)-S-oxide reductase MsrA [Nocardioides guangzhouensis]RYP88245.1 peptide-methionine (S)-S-oxide reductase MsrA [Nocardioides guangzhouensis]